MKAYMILSMDGYCMAPDGTEVDNCQMLGIVNAESESEAKDEIFKQYPDYVSYGYGRENLVAYELK